eukprot:12423279-Karenia_brevis.AAC.1
MRDHQASGLDGWRVAEMRRLPAILLDALADMFNIIEETGRWPAALQQASVSMASKGEGMQPLNMRPISVMSVVYRLWAARRLQDLTAWQELWATNGQHAFRPGHSTADVFWELALRVEHSLMTGEPLMGVGFDYAKCFDRLPRGILFKLAEELGLHCRVLHPLMSMYAGLRFRFKVAGSYGKQFETTNGILQGCPLSVILVNAVMMTWARAVQREVPGSLPKAFADDTGAT